MASSAGLAGARQIISTSTTGISSQRDDPTICSTKCQSGCNSRADGEPSRDWHLPGSTKSAGRGQAASLASTTKMHLEVMNLPTDDRDWLPLAANPQKWWKLINKKLHEVSSGPEARATLPQRKRLIDKTRQDKENLRTFLPERSRHCAREARTCAGRGVDAPASSSSISGGLRNQRFETHYRSVRLTGKKVNRQTAVGLVQTGFINATIPGNSPGP